MLNYYHSTGNLEYGYYTGGSQIKQLLIELITRMILQQHRPEVSGSWSRLSYLLVLEGNPQSP